MRVLFSLLDEDGNVVSRHNNSVKIDGNDVFNWVRFKFYTERAGRYTVRLTVSYDALAFLYYSINLFAPE